MAQGTATLEFGAFPGTDQAYVDVTGQTGFTAALLAEAWLYPIATSSANGSHSADEHRVEELEVVATYLADGQIRIYGRHVNKEGPVNRDYECQLIYGPWTVAWAWA